MFHAVKFIGWEVLCYSARIIFAEKAKIREI